MKLCEIIWNFMKKAMKLYEKCIKTMKNIQNYIK